ncbi:hypothetical protein Sliba_46490 [Streptomyces nigrescens]|uniref:Uncharacterized protein n=1 Tax=Streptomyces nigrescens TaxID=1920 RepID=A0A640TPV4_STRNI|nr:hypothetical protein Sliba_46490 [Streptomyces libani subsp. libani]GGW00154.1 hypothetical protein GCM10010500_52590 [Streptomyces libani subsp. libani]
MRRIAAADFTGSPQRYIAQLDVTTGEIESRWGSGDITWDDLGAWITFAFELNNDALVALVREKENAPAPGYILTAIGRTPPNEVLMEFIGEFGIPHSRVAHKGFP